jgi:alcohol dehydrogenase class IV
VNEPAFTARGFPWRLHSSLDAIGSRLRAEVNRLGASRAFVLTSPSIAKRTATAKRVEHALGDAHAGTYAGIENDSTYRSVMGATHAARQAEADLIVAVGGGSVIVAARAVDIFLSEDADPFRLMTQYPEGGRASTRPSCRSSTSSRPRPRP